MVRGSIVCLIIAVFFVVLLFQAEINITTEDYLSLGASSPSKIMNSSNNSGKKMRYITTKFEVYGRVQGVFFRKYTKKKADELGLKGWCRNTPRDTVEGEFEYNIQDGGEEEEEQQQHYGSEAFRHWLCNVGSPRSSIDRCKFGERVVGDQPKYDTFRVIH